MVKRNVPEFLLDATSMGHASLISGSSGSLGSLRARGAQEAQGAWEAWRSWGLKTEKRPFFSCLFQQTKTKFYFIFFIFFLSVCEDGLRPHGRISSCAQGKGGGRGRGRGRRQGQGVGRCGRAPMSTRTHSWVCAEAPLSAGTQGCVRRDVGARRHGCVFLPSARTEKTHPRGKRGYARLSEPNECLDGKI
jgi:hypothetical protein